jgi:hypothetical protein
MGVGVGVGGHQLVFLAVPWALLGGARGTTGLGRLASGWWLQQAAPDQVTASEFTPGVASVLSSQ